jgi:hypothetical protein
MTGTEHSSGRRVAARGPGFTVIEVLTRTVAINSAGFAQVR